MEEQKEKSEIKENIRKFWKWLKGDSFGSWIVSIILAFVFVKFIFFPVLSLIFATSLPLVVVESGSMHHPQTFAGGIIGISDFNAWYANAEGWYNIRNISLADMEDWSFKNGMDKGDIILVYGKKDLGVGDVIIFEADQKYPIIHRVVNKTIVNGRVIYETKGDNNNDQLPFEKEVTQDEIIGSSLLRIPKLGWIKLGLVELLDKIRGN
ncbi:signal peptidase I [Candidatus Woesearchaeota archaeon CG10_big_fil_rev_8_21_14_0_10_34_12]|nr:MAG: signal peptidase I [Candidatus Woesearchaeota archaeon CG10_big_fil_rev_8_21_14_0_10_34_12]